eukprot:TRINITY_DN11906_c0_g1_i2.p1 TRINITY_DN11906_c0_g1~~TRINITY_DN11906_c0_g1_i2.p1  ORF type:complete len:271 (-),score=57.27 TRINITY_DN11906_c0_g1_i2:50-862(-)
MITRHKTSYFSSPEDRKPTHLNETEISGPVQRLLYIAGNDMETILPFFISVFLWRSIVGYSDIYFQDNQVVIGLGVVFCVMRVLHSLLYGFRIYTVALLSFIIGELITLSILGWTVAYVALYDNSNLFATKMVVVLVWGFLTIKLYFVNAVYIRSTMKNSHETQKVNGDSAYLLYGNQDELLSLIPYAICTYLLFDWHAYHTEIDFWGFSFSSFMFIILRTFHTFFNIQKEFQPGKSGETILIILENASMFIQFYWIIISSVSQFIQKYN